jgi:hypothetical protein
VLGRNLGNLSRRLVLPKRIHCWSLTNLPQLLVKTGTPDQAHPILPAVGSGESSHAAPVWAHAANGCGAPIKTGIPVDMSKLGKQTSRNTASIKRKGKRRHESHHKIFCRDVTQQSTLTLTDQPNHAMNIAEVRDAQKSSDSLWNNSKIAYWGVTDLLDGKGTQRGYFNNIHRFVPAVL